MVLLGALINGLEAAVGGVLGLLFKGRVSERLGDFLLKGQGLAVVLVAVQGMMQGGSVAIVTLSLPLGSVIGLGIDIDARIAEKAGCSIPEIFAKGGEAAFRALEREATAACGALSGKLLLTGGGVVKTPENYAALHQNGRIYQLLRPLELLPTDGRPLSQGADLAAMWAERAPLYERFRDAAIDNSGTVEQTAQAIWRDFCENSGH